MSVISTKARGGEVFLQRLCDAPARCGCPPPPPCCSPGFSALQSWLRISSLIRFDNVVGSHKLSRVFFSRAGGRWCCTGAARCVQPCLHLAAKQSVHAPDFWGLLNLELLPETTQMWESVPDLNVMDLFFFSSTFQLLSPVYNYSVIPRCPSIITLGVGME